MRNLKKQKLYIIHLRYRLSYCSKGNSDKPILLNLKGNYKELNNHDAVAIIGTREPTDAGIISAKFFGEQFGRKGYNVVSGLC